MHEHQQKKLDCDAWDNVIWPCLINFVVSALTFKSCS